MKAPKAVKLPSGAWRCRIRLDGQDVSITRPTEKEAIAEAMAVKAGLRTEARTAGRDRTLAQAIDVYIESNENVLSPSTIRGYTMYRKSRFQKYMSRKLSTMTQEQWQRAVNAEAKEVSPKYLRNCWGLIHAAILFSTGQEIQVNLPAVAPKDLEFLDREQLGTFCAAIKGRKVEVPALLALESLRRSEILALTWDNVDLEKDIIHVRGAAVIDRNSNLVQKPTNKNKTSTRDIPFIYPQLKAALTAVPLDRRQGPVNTMYYTTIIESINRICKSCGLPEVGVHGLRRSFATLCHGLGVPEHYTMVWGGWSNIQTVHKVYIKLDQQAGAEYADKLKAVFQETP